MPKIIPFKAVRPTRDKVSLIASRSYQTYTEEERNARMEYNPFSFLHIVNPGYKYHRQIQGKERYTLVKNRYLEFKEDGIFIQDKKPSYYIYRIVNREGYTFNGIIAAASTEDYKNNCIKKHEDTIEYRENLFKDYLKTVGFNAEAVLLTYPDNESISNIIKEIQQLRAEYEFTTTYRDTHYLWKIEDDNIIQNIQNAFKTMDSIYIADGHHRTSSSFLLAKEMRNQKSKNENYSYFMSYLIPESELIILEFNRLIKDLNGLSKEEFLIRLDANFRIENRKSEMYQPSKKHHFSMYLEGEFYSLYLRKSIYKINNALDALDTQILYKTILEPILGISDLKNDKRIAYSNNKNGLIDIKTQVDNKVYVVGFAFVPITINEMKAMADQGLIMPPKSTYILPKLRSGITIYEF